MEPTAGAARTRAKWGDRVGRRRDILRAAAEVLEHRGFDHFNVRNIARGAGVSAATLYSYFPTKNDIFASLLIHRFGDLRTTLDQLDRVDDDALRSVEALVLRLVPELTDMYRHFGRHVYMWIREETKDSAMVGSLEASFVEATGSLERALRRAAANEGLELDDAPMLMPYVWTTLFGIADNNLTNMHAILGYTREGLARYCAGALAHGLARPRGAIDGAPRRDRKR